MRPILAAAGVALALTVAPGATGQTTKTPKLRIAGQIIVGVNFHARERVRVRFIRATTYTRVLRTNAKGTFSTPLTPFDSCTQLLTVKAVGARGDSASVVVPKTNCLPK